MKFRPKDFFVPSVVFHGCVVILLIIICWKVPTIKTPKEKQFRVSLVKLPVPPAAAVSKPPKEVSKPVPKVEPKVEPKVKPKVKPKIKPKVKSKVKPRRKILTTPKKIIKKQEEWVSERKKKIVKKKLITNTTQRVVWKPDKEIEKPKTVYQPPTFKSKDAFIKSQQKLKELEKSLDKESSSLKKKMDSYVQASRFTGGTSGAQATIINNFFQRNILTAIDSVWTPPSAALVPKKSQCTIAFTLSKNGSVSNVRIVRRSGFSVLDDSAKSAVQQADFPTFPPDLNKNFLNVEVPFVCEPNE